MDLLEKRKLNLLVHLAKIDGKYDKAERELLRIFAQKRGIDELQVDAEETPMRFTELAYTECKIELMYWALKLIQADEIIHDKEILFCKNMAGKLGFKEEMVEAFAYKELPPFNEFEIDVIEFWQA